MKKIYLLLTILLSLNMLPQSGSLDATFGNNGKVHTGFGESNSRANAVAVQPDGKIIVGGTAYTANTVNSWEKDTNNLVLVRYNTDGSIDTSFGNDGKVVVDFYTFSNDNNYNSEAYCIILQPDGKILVYGGLSSRAILVRFNADGSPDAGFGNHGKVSLNFTPVNGGNTIKIQPDGKIVVLGMLWIQPTPNNFNTQFVIGRYNSDGSIDTTFGTAGQTVTAFGAGYDWPMALALQPDGKILAVGRSFNNQTAIARYTTNGNLDPTFDGDGKKITSFEAGTNSAANFVTVHPDGKILTVGTKWPNTGITGINLTFIKYNTNGSLDSSFDGDGKATDPFAIDDSSFYINAVSPQPDGKILVATSASNADQADAIVIRRYNSDATKDSSFGTNGKTAITFQDGFNTTQNIALQPDAKILLVGYSHSLPSLVNDFNIARFQSNGTLDLSFNVDGKISTTFDSSNDESTMLLLQPDNKFLAIGTKRNRWENNYLVKDLALSRYNNDGSPDHTFGVLGKVVSAFGANLNTPTNAVLQLDGKIVVSNTYYTQGANFYTYELIRYTNTGSLDSSFGSNGKVTVDAEKTSLLSQPDGKIITTSQRYDPENATTLLLLKRYNNNGTADNSFGIDGTASVTGIFYGPANVVIQADGKILVTSTSPDNDGLSGFSTMRFHSDGSLDTSFETVVTVQGFGLTAKHTLILPDGKFIVAGSGIASIDGTNSTFFVAARYHLNGSLDTSYGTNGLLSSYLGGPFEPYKIIRSAVRQPDGKFLVALGKTDDNPDSCDFVISRFNIDGSYDNDFGTTGQVMTGLYNKYDEAFSMILQPDNKIVVAGVTDTGINRDFALVRYENSIDLGVNHFNSAADVVLYPNPTKDILYLKTADVNGLKILDYSIYNMLGQSIYNGSGTDLQIHTANFSKGIYNILIQTDKGKVSKKFIKE